MNQFFKSLSIIWSLSAKKYKLKLIILLFLIIFSAIFEVLSIGLTLPYITFLVDPEKFVTNYSFFFSFLPIMDINNNNLILILTLAFVTVILLSTFVRVLLIKFQSEFAYSLGAYLCEKLFNSFILMSYSDFVNTRSSDITSVIMIKANRVVVNILLPIISIISSIFIILMVLLFFVYFLSIKIFIVLSVLVAVYMFFILVSRIQLRKFGIIINNDSEKLHSILNNAYGGFREILLDNYQAKSEDTFIRSSERYNTAQAKVHIISSIPRYFVEAIFILSTITIAYFWIESGYPADELISLMAILIVGVQRLMPLMQQVYSGLSVIRSGLPALEDVTYWLMKAKINTKILKVEKKVTFKKNIILENISFKHNSKNNYIFKDISMEIKINERIGIIGETGEGKSTFVDLIMGLLFSSKGTIKIDDTLLLPNNAASWYDQISHVPQSIFLIDGNILENIAFGEDYAHIDFEKVDKCIKIAMLENFIINQPDGIYSKLGERGIKISGGQRQRIGIARALYKNASLLVFDEATSALDYETEKQIMSNIERSCSNLTMLIITHREEILEYCTKVYEVKNTSVNQLGQ
jgi:ATP-binding cassette, subfamily B, bacterial PglK